MRFLRGKDRAAKALKIIADGDWRTYLFGGTLREIMLRSHDRNFRDLDVVLDDLGFESFKSTFASEIKGMNSFGGLRLEVQGFKVDAWSISSTWAFKRGLIKNPSVKNLQKTTFLNLDSIVMEITPGRIRRKRVYADGFLEAVNRNTLDMVLPDNPMPDLAAVRALKMHVSYKLELSRSIAKFLSKYLDSTSSRNCVQHQLDHYGRVILNEESVDRLRCDLHAYIKRRSATSFAYQRQLLLLDSDDAKSQESGRSCRISARSPRHLLDAFFSWFSNKNTR